MKTIVTIDLDYYAKISYESIKLVGSFNELICVAIEEKTCFSGIRQLRSLTFSSSETDFFYMYDFGYDELHNDYKAMLYWAINNKLFGYYNDWVFLVVDLADGRWKKMENPCYGESTLTLVYVWVMKVYGFKEFWTKMFNIMYTGYHSFGTPFCMSSEGEFLFENILFFMIYNPSNDSKRFPRTPTMMTLLRQSSTLKALFGPFAKRTRNATTTSKTTKAQMKTIIVC
ncbi:hypothetical protein H5410_005904 [Solanum commersonii]|uniref:F-box associated domain-containing protein n=1 Tax=Solanum commersonii TaxID=4109 RepID=A0A9J6A7P4_SOLCO|nr:hypothetical protein H5410_005904 [Solanum commersonii]